MSCFLSSFCISMEHNFLQVRIAVVGEHPHHANAYHSVFEVNDDPWLYFILLLVRIGSLTFTDYSSLQPPFSTKGKLIVHSSRYLCVQAIRHASVACQRRLLVNWFPASDIEQETADKVSKVPSYSCVQHHCSCCHGLLIILPILLIVTRPPW